MTLARFPTGPKTKRLAQERLYRLFWEWTLQEKETAFLDTARKHVPEAWAFIEADLDVDEPKDKVTLYLDRSVAKLFRAMGAGYQARINRILATWAQMKMAELRALEMDYLDALEASHAERDADAPETAVERTMRDLAEQWAFQKGVEEGKRLAGER